MVTPHIRNFRANFPEQSPWQLRHVEQHQYFRYNEQTKKKQECEKYNLEAVEPS